MEYFMTTRLLNGFSFEEWEQKIEKLPIDSNLLVFYWLTIGTLGTKESGPSRFTSTLEALVARSVYATR